MIPFKILDTFPPLLDSLGIETLWKSLLYTLVKQDYPEVFIQINRSVHFLHVVELDINYLHDLTIGEVGILYEFSLSYVNHQTRKTNGQYFTPDDVAEKMVEFASSFPPNKVWLDPCCGVGNLSYWLIKQQSDPETFLAKQMRFTDVDPLALIICGTLLTALFHSSNPHLFEEVERNMFVSSFLDDNLSEYFTYDYVLMNPPYADTNPDLRFDTHKIHDVYAYFMEKAIKCSKGFIAVTPQTYTHAAKYKILREMLLNHGNHINIYCFDNIPDSFFHGFKYGSQNGNTANSVRAAITVFRKETTSENTFGITPLMRWKTTQREEFLNIFPKLLNTDETLLTPDMFYRNSTELNSFFHAVTGGLTLKALLSPTKTSYVLYVPGTPRYFISAASKPLARYSTRILYFTTEYDYLYAYSLLNSRVIYWWWRLVDGGMTLSHATLSTLPLPEYKKISLEDLKTISQLLQTSETKNLILNTNVGTVSENIKHPVTLVDEITVKLTSDKTNSLFKVLYSNSIVDFIEN